MEELFHLYDSLLMEAINIRIPEFDRGILQQGEMMTIEVENLAVPIINFYTGEIDYTGADFEQFPIYVSFNGGDAPVETEINIETSTPDRLQVIVPDNAATGKISLLIPVVEIFNPNDLFSRSEESDGICMCTKDEITADNIREHILSKMEEMPEKIVHYPMFVTFSNVKCNCTVKCPNKAIDYDAYGNCYIKEDDCKGHKYSLEYDSNNKKALYWNKQKTRQYYRRGKETQCWKCLTTMNKCKFNKIRKSVYCKREPWCCGQCNVHSQLLDQTLKELCPYGAITGGKPIDKNSVPGNLGEYYLDPHKCKACLKCYDGIVCHNNLSETVFVMHMGAYIPKLKGTLELKSITLYHLIVKPANFLPGSIMEAYYHYLDKKYLPPTEYRLVVSGDKDKWIDFTLDSNNRHPFTEKIDFTVDACLELLEMRSGFMYMPIFFLKGQSMATRKIPAGNVGKGTISFETKKGTFVLEYNVRARP